MFRIISITLFLLFLSPTLLIAQTVIPGGTVSGQWTLDGSPYLIQGDIIIADDTVLDIEAGVQVEFQGYYYLRCEGQINAIGTENDTIIFTASNPFCCWDGIDFVDLDYNSMDSSRLEFCEISYGKASLIIGPKWDTLRITSSGMSAT